MTWGAQPGTLDAVFIKASDGDAMAPLTDLYLPSIDSRQRGGYANDPHTNAKVSEVRQWLAERLPEYMVPTHIMVLEELPLTSSGKIDRKALPEPTFAATSFRAPQTDTQKIVAEVFTEVLGLGRAGLDDDFFALGGDSLIAIRVSSRLQAALGRDVPVRYLFDAPTVGGLADYLERHQDGVARPPLTAQHRPEAVPLSYAQQRLWFLEQLHGPSPIYNMAVALRLRGHLDADALGAALVDVVGRQESLRTIFGSVDGVPHQLVVDVEMADLGWQIVDAGGWPAGRLDAAIGETVRHSFDLAREIPHQGNPFPGRRQRARIGGRGASHRRRRMVDRPVGDGSGHRLRQSLHRTSPGVGTVAGSVRRLHVVAAGLDGVGHGSRQCDLGPVGVLEGRTRWAARAVGAAHGSTLSTGGRLPGLECGGRVARRIAAADRSGGT